MPFATTQSVISTDMDNILRGLYRDNSDSAKTGPAAGFALKSLTIAGNTIGPTGAIHIVAAGTLTGISQPKSISISFGGTSLVTIAYAAPDTGKWFFDIWGWNTATNSQRWLISRCVGTGGSVVGQESRNTSVIDTTASQVLSVKYDNAGGTDTATQTMFDVSIVQIQ